MNMNTCVYQNTTKRCNTVVYLYYTIYSVLCVSFVDFLHIPSDSYSRARSLSISLSSSSLLLSICLHFSQYRVDCEESERTNCKIKRDTDTETKQKRTETFYRLCFAQSSYKGFINTVFVRYP